MERRYPVSRPDCWVRAVLALATLCVLACMPLDAETSPDALVAPPLNPEFIAYMRDKASGKEPLQATEDGHGLGRIPPPLDLSKVRGNPLPLAGNYPAQFDLRTLGKLTQIGNQETCGCCWTFASLGSLESCLRPAQTWNLSENNMKDRHGWLKACCDGGWVFTAMAYLARWDGPKTEQCDPFTVECVSQDNCDTVLHLQDVHVVPDRTGPLDNDQIKDAVMTYGALYTTFCWNDACYNPATYAYYYNGTAGGNHAVCIVGWDDNFPASSFVTPPPGNGAFLIKNSWGTGWGDGGFGYVSYYDTRFGWEENAAFYGVESVNNYASKYEYDPLGWTYSIGYTTGAMDMAWFANVFTAAGAEDLSAVSFYAYQSQSPYEIRVYMSPTNGPINPAGDVVQARKTGVIETPGYHTIKLPATVHLTTGQRFSVVVKLTTPGYAAPIPIETPVAGVVAPTAHAGESYVSHDGANWSDITVAYNANTNVCLKAFTGGGVNGTLQGTVKDSKTGSGIAGATLTAGASSTSTNASGQYTLTLSQGTYSVTASAQGYSPETKQGITVLANETTTVNFTLAAQQQVTVHGVVTDEAHGWPLYASILVVEYEKRYWTNPCTGSYNISLLPGESYTFVVTAWSGGYLAATRTVENVTTDRTEDFVLSVDADTQTLPPGYIHAEGYAQDFESSDGGFTASGPNSCWQWGTPTSGPAVTHSGTKCWATNLSGDYNDNEDSCITSPNIDLSEYAGTPMQLSWWQWLYTEEDYDYASVEISSDGGTTWNRIYGGVSGIVDTVWVQHTYKMQASYSTPQFRMRFRLQSDYYVTYAGYYVDDITIGGIAPISGGLVAGCVYDIRGQTPLPGATVSDDAGYSTTSVATEDPKVPDSFYLLFSPSGSHKVSASKADYLTSEATISVPFGGTVCHDFSLSPASPGVLPGLTIGNPSVPATRSGPVVYTITYTDADVVTLAATHVTLNKTGTANGTVQVSGTGKVTRSVTISNITGDGTLGISIAAGTASNINGVAPAAGPSQAFLVDNTPPGVSVSPPSSGATVGSPVAYTISYTGATTISLSNAQVSLNKTGTASGAVAISGTGSAARTITILGISGDGSLGVSIAGGSATDAAGNVAGPAGPSAVFTVHARPADTPRSDFNGDGSDDLAGTDGDGRVLYSTDRSTWSSVPRGLVCVATGDVDGNNKDEYVALDANGFIFYTADWKHWVNVPGQLTCLALGDINGDGSDDISGLSFDGSIWYTTNKNIWTRIPGELSKIVAGDLNGDGKADLAGINSNGLIFYTTDKATWTNVPGQLADLAAGDLNGDGKADIAGINSVGLIFYTTNKSTWTNVPGQLSCLAVGDMNADGKADIAGLATTGSVWYTTNKSTWVRIPGTLSKLALGDLDGNGSADVAGIDPAGSARYTTNKSTWVSMSGQVSSITIGDLDGDGKDDLAGTCDGVPLVSTDKRTWTRLLRKIRSLVTGDLNADGRSDIVIADSDGYVFYSLDRLTWQSIPGQFLQLVMGDLDGNGVDDIAALDANGSIFYTTNRRTWKNIPGQLAHMIVGDFDGNHATDLAGLSSSGAIWFTTNKYNWTRVPGTLTTLTAGDFNGDGSDDLAGLTSLGATCYTTNKSTWSAIAGQLSCLIAGDFDGNGRDDFAGLNTSGLIFYCSNLTKWTNVKGQLSCLRAGDMNCDRQDELGGLNSLGMVFWSPNDITWSVVPGILSNLWCSR